MRDGVFPNNEVSPCIVSINTSPSLLNPRATPFIYNGDNYSPNLLNMQLELPILVENVIANSAFSMEKGSHPSFSSKFFNANNFVMNPMAVNFVPFKYLYTTRIGTYT